MATRSEEITGCASDEFAAMRKIDFTDSQRYLLVEDFHIMLSFMVQNFCLKTFS